MNTDFEDLDDIEDIEDIEVEDFDEEDNTPASSFAARRPAKQQPEFSPARMYVTGIITGILLVTVVMMLSDFFNWHPFSTTPAADKIYNLTKVLESYIDKYYWKSDTSDTQFANMAGKGMVAALGDQFSVYMTPEELARTRERNAGDYTGIGASIGEDPATGRKYITRIEQGAPADKAGMRVGDEILELDGESVRGLTVDDMVSRIRGDEGVSHKVKIFRVDTTASGSAVSGTPADGAVSGSSVSGDSSDLIGGQTLTLTVVTENIINQSVHHQMLKDKIGYIRISNYDRETPKQFREALEDLNKQGMKGLILDVRNNGGGVLTSVLDVLDELLPAGTLLTETRKGFKDEVYKSTDKEHFDKPMTVLINGMSASAAEVFAGVLQDTKKATLIGETSYGKGIVQSIFTLPDDLGGIKLTTGEYLLPSGRSIHGKGLTPDIVLPFAGTDEDYGTNNDNQLIRALNLMQEETK